MVGAVSINLIVVVRFGSCAVEEEAGDIGKVDKGTCREDSKAQEGQCEGVDASDGGKEAMIVGISQAWPDTFVVENHVRVSWYCFR